MRTKISGFPLMDARSPKASPVVYGAAFVSGFAVLVFELSWLRLLTLHLGSTWPILTVLLCTFLGGLGLGAWAGGRLALRVARPLQAFAVLQGLGLAAATALPSLVSHLVDLELPDLSHGLTGSVQAGAMLLLPLAALLGAGFPLLARVIGSSGLPALYGVSTLGASAGGLAGGLWLPYALGVPGTLVVAFAMQTIAALAALGVRGSQPDREQGPPPSWRLALCAPLLGWVAGAGELLWVRSLLEAERTLGPALLPPDDLGAMATVLSLLLLGNAVGALGAAMMPPLDGSLEAGLLSGLFLTLSACFPAALEWFSVRAGAAWWSWFSALAPALAVGAAGGLLVRRFGPRRAGDLGLLALVGAGAGGLLAGAVLLPRLGLAGSVMMEAFLCLGLALLCMPRRGLGYSLAAAGAIGFCLLVLAMEVPRQPGQFRGGVLAWWEGWEGTTLVAEVPSGLALLTNGRQVEEGPVDLPARLAPNARSALLVGFGTGRLAQALLALPEMERLLIDEVHPGRLRLASRFRTQAVLEDPRVEVEVEDPMYLVADLTRSLDLAVVAVSSPPLNPGPYTVEFHTRLRERLSPDGVVWVRTGPSPAAEATMREVYPYAWRAEVGLVGSMRPEPGLIGLEPLPPGGARPLRHLHPQRLRNTANR